MTRTVFFDVDSTLYSEKKAHAAAMGKLYRYGRETLSLDPETMDRLIGESRRTVYERLGYDNAAIHNRLIRFQGLAEGLPENRNDRYIRALEMYHIYWGAYLEAMEPEPYIRELIGALRGAGIRVGVGTDMTAYMQYKKLEKLGLLSEIQYIVTSEEAGAEKPSPKFFRLCIEKAGCRPGECVFIGDNLKKDVEGSVAAGMRGIWYRPEGGAPEGRYPSIASYKECMENGIIDI